jgi:hypothetical protein
MITGVVFRLMWGADMGGLLRAQGERGRAAGAARVYL